MRRFKPEVYAWLRALINRVGKAETARLTMIDPSYISKLVGSRPPDRVHPRTARVILQAYIDVLQRDIVISRNAIKHGAFERGKDAPRPKTVRDYYQRDGDLGAEKKRRYRELH